MNQLKMALKIISGRYELEYMSDEDYASLGYTLKDLEGFRKTQYPNRYELLYKAEELLAKYFLATMF